ncbi:MAG: hypothetical protein IT259_07575 [Saprospiraceae bacterium]|nr:hypothetical protein [Saprospiraceae bacterium]
MYLTIKKIFVLASLIFFMTPNQGHAQNKSARAGALSQEAIAQLHLAEDTLAILAFAVVNDSLETTRFGACRALITCLVRNLKAENSFNYPFSRLKSLSIMAPPDSSFRIFTWQLFVNDSTYRYYGAIQINRGELELYPLIDRSFEFEAPPPFYEKYSPERWYGALYYNLRQFDTREGRKYLLFGFDAYSFFEKRKVIEVLHFDAKGKPVFGAEVFANMPGRERGPQVSRLIFEYASDASVRVNWDEQYQMVLFDHLIPMASPYGRGMAMVPDGSYDGLKLDKAGRWVWVDKVFNDVMEEAPRPEPILDDRKGKDITGKPKQSKGERRP